MYAFECCDCVSLCVCVCVCAYVGMYVCMYVSLCVRAHTRGQKLHEWGCTESQSELKKLCF